MLHRITPDGPQVHCDLSEFGPSLNDMVALPDGRAYVDVYTEREAGPRLATLRWSSPMARRTSSRPGLATPNGLAVTPDARRCGGETFGSRLHAWTIQTDGSLTGQRVFADLGERKPDGLCLDVEDGVWVGYFLSGEFCACSRAARSPTTSPSATAGPWRLPSAARRCGRSTSS